VSTPQPRWPGLRRRINRLTAEHENLEADDLKEALSTCGATDIAACPDREQVCIAGTLRTVTLRPRAGVPVLEAELWDGTGSVVVTWLGRRQIPGITPGRNIIVRGRITTVDRHRAIYNPIYQLRPGGAD
jgi:hypothetical protein